MIWRIFKTFLGTFLVAVGIVIFLHPGMGADPLSVFLQGIMSQTGEFLGSSTFGTLSMSFGFLVLCAVFFVDRSKIGLGSVVNSIFVGVFLNVLYGLGLDRFLPDMGILLIVLGPVVIGFGLAVYLSAGLGAGSTEAIMLIIVERSRFSIKSIRIVQDALFVGVGLLLGASYGLGLLSGIFLIGPSIEYSLKLIGKKSG
ncbi:MAG: hypothetical protein FWF59_15675 [Turicibacter sp.]|nr:hypothetical protein [Turicibacter sp.]